MIEEFLMADEVRVDPTVLHMQGGALFLHADTAHAESVRNLTRIAQESVGWVGSSAAALSALATAWEAQDLALHARATAAAESCRHCACQFAEQEAANQASVVAYAVVGNADDL